MATDAKQLSERIHEVAWKQLMVRSKIYGMVVWNLHLAVAYFVVALGMTVSIRSLCYWATSIFSDIVGALLAPKTLHRRRCCWNCCSSDLARFVWTVSLSVMLRNWWSMHMVVVNFFFFSFCALFHMRSSGIITDNILTQFHTYLFSYNRLFPNLHLMMLFSH